MATHSSVLTWRIPGTGKPGGLLSLGSHRVGHDCSDLAAAAAASRIGCRDGRMYTFVKSINTMRQPLTGARVRLVCPVHPRNVSVAPACMLGSHLAILTYLSFHMDCSMVCQGQCTRKSGRGNSLVAQWVRTRPPMQGTWGRSLVSEDSTCCRAVESACHNS